VESVGPEKKRENAMQSMGRMKDADLSSDQALQQATIRLVQALLGAGDQGFSIAMTRACGLV
jgi:hypothetical protein